MGIDIAIVIVSFNSDQVLADLLDSVPAALDGLVADVVVVDNGSTDHSCELVERRDDCRLVRSTNRGYAAGVNGGVAACRADAVLVLNADVVLASGCVAPLLLRLSAPGVGVVVPRVVEADGALHLSLRREPTLLRAMGLGRSGHPALAEYVTDPAQYADASSGPWALGAAMLISRRCFAAVGGWDESYFLYSEETDFCLRARDLGWSTWYEPASTVTHIGGQSGRNDKTHVMQIVNRVRLYARRHGVVAAWAYYLLTILSELSWVARAHPQSRAAVRALLVPAYRPVELGCGDARLPR